MHLTAVDDVPFRDQDLAVLGERFAAGPRTSGWAGNFGGPDPTIHRFKRPGQRVWVATHPEQTEWWLSADSAASLAALTELLANANQAKQALVRELGKGWRWTSSERVQGPDGSPQGRCWTGDAAIAPARPTSGHSTIRFGNAL